MEQVRKTPPKTPMTFGPTERQYLESLRSLLVATARRVEELEKAVAAVRAAQHDN